MAPDFRYENEHVTFQLMIYFKAKKMKWKKRTIFGMMESFLSMTVCVCVFELDLEMKRA